jgi:predicted Zn-dependent peptidase
VKEIIFEQFNEKLYYETLANGLEVYILPKQGFNKTYATFTTKYGSIDNHFASHGEKEPLKVPDGIAHFLEHKMFEDEEGDVFQLFSKQGASANAFTSFTRTAYLFSSTSEVEKNLTTLIDFVQHPYFTEASVEKEKGIIAQEITMYEDNPDWRAYFGIIQNMYQNHPVRIDIAGTIESIDKITKDLLYKCYETFYHPKNMVLFVIGSLQPEEILALVKTNQAKKTFKEFELTKRIFDEEPKQVAKKKTVLNMSVHTPKCLVAFKEKNPTRQGQALLKHELSINVLLDLMLGQSSNNFEKLYQEGLIDDSFSFDYSAEIGFGFSIIGGDTKDPDQLVKTLEEMVVSFIETPLADEAVRRAIKKKIGSFMRAVNSPEYIANQFTRYQFNGMNLFDVVETLEKLTKAELEQKMKDHFDPDMFTVCQIMPK